MSSSAAPSAQAPAVTALLQGLLQAREREQDQLLAQLGVEPADGRPLIQQLERVALLRLLLQQLQLTTAGPALGSAPAMSQWNTPAGFAAIRSGAMARCSTGWRPAAAAAVAVSWCRSTAPAGRRCGGAGVRPGA